MNSRLIRAAIGLFIAGFLWCVVLGIVVWRYGMHDHASKSDCIIVLGAAVRETTPSPVFAERIRHGVNLYNARYAPKLLFTGGKGDGQNHSEASVGRTIAIQHGISSTSIILEEKSRTTQQNLSEALAVMRLHGMKSAIIVSDPLHMKRAIMMADDLGIDASSSPTPTSRYKSLKTKILFLFREVYFIHHYLVTGD